ncbi:MAG: hypothetical protein MUC99_09100 [Anaerolineae bacterium]|nr:hypothetical protein [Anaerolineae bacterium]
MTTPITLVTGSMGCLGAWALAHLARRNERAISFDLSTDRSRLNLLLTPDEQAAITFITRRGRPRRHAHHPPRRAPSPVLPRQPRFGRAGQRNRHHQRVRGRQTRRPDPSGLRLQHRGLRRAARLPHGLDRPRRAAPAAHPVRRL